MKIILGREDGKSKGVNMKIVIGSVDWLELRRTKIMASDAPILMGVGFCTPEQLYHRKVKGIEQPVNPAMQRGIDLEPVARQEFEKLTGHFVWPECRLHPKIEWLGATFDGINDEGIVCEIKCPGMKDHIEAICGNVPKKYYPQCQHQMIVAEVKEMFYFSYHPDHDIPTVLLKVILDEAYCAGMLEIESAFHINLMNKVEPQQSYEILEDEKLLVAECSLYHKRAKLKELEKEIEQLENEIIQDLGGKECKGNYLHFKPQESKGSLDYKKFLADHLLTVPESYRKPSVQKWVISPLSKPSLHETP